MKMMTPWRIFGFRQEQICSQGCQSKPSCQNENSEISYWYPCFSSSELSFHSKYSNMHSNMHFFSRMNFVRECVQDVSPKGRKVIQVHRPRWARNVQRLFCQNFTAVTLGPYDVSTFVKTYVDMQFHANMWISTYTDSWFDSDGTYTLSFPVHLSSAEVIHDVSIQMSFCCCCSAQVACVQVYRKLTALKADEQSEIEEARFFSDRNTQKPKYYEDIHNCRNITIIYNITLIYVTILVQ